jgi:hypothetical protein
MKNQECRIEDYILPERDDKGKSFSICFRIPPVLWDEVNRLAGAGKFPFETRQTLFRWAFYRGIRSLASIKDKDNHQIPILELPFLAFQTQWPEKDSTFFTKLRGIVLQLKALGYSQERLLRFTKAIEELIECLPESHRPQTYRFYVGDTWRSCLISIPKKGLPLWTRD